MNQTEAWELVIRAAEMCQQDERWRNAMPRLAKAISRTKPKVEKMRARLDDQRARRAGKPKCPAWARP